MFLNRTGKDLYVDAKRLSIISNSTEFSANKSMYYPSPVK